MGLAILACAECRGSVVDATIFSSAYPNGGFHAYSFDASTESYYHRTGADGGYPEISVYNSDAALASNSPSRTVTPQGDTFSGTYFAVRDGRIYGYSYLSNNVNKWNATTGAIEATRPIGDFNLEPSFDSGGFSFVDLLQDSTGLYVLGHTAGVDSWSILQVDADLNIIATRSFTADSLGFAFMLNGKLFTSPNIIFSTVVTQVLDFATGTIEPVSYPINFVPGGVLPYITNTAYDPTRDRLYIYNTGDAKLYSIAHASAAFGTNAVPEPSTFATAGIASLASLIYGWRRRKVA